MASILGPAARKEVIRILRILADILNQANGVALTSTQLALMRETSQGSKEFLQRTKRGCERITKLTQALQALEPEDLPTLLEQMDSSLPAQNEEAILRAAGIE